MTADAAPLPSRHPTAVPGLDAITLGGLPRGRPTLVAGTSGTGKTVLAAQFLAEGAMRGETGVYVTLEEQPEDIRRTFRSFGWPVDEWEVEGLFHILDASLNPDEEVIHVGAFSFTALIGRIRYAAVSRGAQRISIDSISTLFDQYPQVDVVRRELLRLSLELKRLQLTAVLTADRVEEYGHVGRHGVEEFIADNVLILRNVLHEERRRRTVEVLKFRAARHRKGEFPFTIGDDGMVCVPLTSTEPLEERGSARVATGNAVLDEMTGGGYFADSVVLVSGATGTGKTLMATEYIAAGVAAGERCLLLTFEEDEAQLLRSAAAWGIDYRGMVAAGDLRIVAVQPESEGLEDHLVDIHRQIEDFEPDRVALDSLSALERVATTHSARDLVLSVTSFVKEKGIPGLFTSASSSPLHSGSVTDHHMQAVSDTIVVLRYVEVDADVQRGVVVLKMRGSQHDTAIRRFTIGGDGMTVGAPFHGVRGMLGADPRQVPEGSPSGD